MTTKVDNLEYWVQKTIPIVYDDSLSFYELLGKVIAKLNEVIDQSNDYFSKDLKQYVEEILLKWYEDGTLGAIINESLLKAFESYQVTVDVKNPNDITADVQLAYDKIKARGGGTLAIPYGDWVMHGYVELFGNVRVIATPGTKIRKTLLSTSAYTFLSGKTNGTRGYGGGGKNITIESIHFVGAPQDTTTYFANGLAFNHAEHLIIRDCEFTDCIFAGHAIDLAGCRDVLIENNTFRGQVSIPGREYAEAIQIDSSTPTSIGDWSGVDGLPTREVLVQNNKFIPSYTASGLIASYAPNPIGNHGFTGGNYYEQITFKDNFILDAQAYSAGGWRGWVHFYGVKNLKIVGNYFKNTKSIPCNVVQILTSSGGRYDPVTLEAGTGEPLSPMNIEISNNLFEGFDAPDAYTIIRAYGTTYNSVEYNVENFQVNNNQFERCGNPSMEVDTGCALVNIYHYVDVVVTGNVAEGGKLLGSIWDGKNLTFNNNIGKKLANCLLYHADSFNTVCTGNQAETLRRPLEFEEVDRLTVANNVLNDVLNFKGESFANKFRNVSNAQVSHNVTVAGDTLTSYANYFYTAATIKTIINVWNVYNGSSGFTRTTNISGSADFVNYNAVGEA